MNIEFQEFYLNMQIIQDELERRQISSDLYVRGDPCVLTDVRPCNISLQTDGQYVYVGTPDEVRSMINDHPDVCFVISAPVDYEIGNRTGGVIVLREEVEVCRVFTVMLEIFAKFRRWTQKLWIAADSANPIDEIVSVSCGILRNPIFMHDSHFYILADPHHVPAMHGWEKEPRTGRTIVPASLINDFRLDPEYLKGLSARSAVLFSENQTGYRILYRNLWDKRTYLGRILVDEVENPIQKGDYAIIDYLGDLLEYFMRHKKVVWLSMGSGLEEFMRGLLEKGKAEKRQTEIYLRYMGWKMEDQYYCLRLQTDQPDFNLLSSESIIGQIDMAIPECYSLYIRNGITVIVDLTAGHQSIEEVVSSIAIIIRESLLKVGISSGVHSFSYIADAARQAELALEYGMVGDSMYWYYYFDAYLLEYILDCAGREMPLEVLRCEAVRKLEQYDRNNNTELCHTLEVYLKCGRNVLRTSEELYIHRSTLNYRLNRIRTLIHADLDDPKERLKTLLSFYMT